MNGGQTSVTSPLNVGDLESSGSYNSLPDETRRGPLEQAFRRRTVRDVLALVDDLDAKAEFAPLERAYVVYSVLKTRQYADEGARWANLGAIIFFVGIVCAALTPALVALTGMYAFSNAPKFHRLQFAAICASLMGTIAHACVEIRFYGAFVASTCTPSTRRLLDDVAMPVPHTGARARRFVEAPAARPRANRPRVRDAGALRLVLQPRRALRRRRGRVPPRRRLPYILRRLPAPPGTVPRRRQVNILSIRKSYDLLREPLLHHEYLGLDEVPPFLF